LRASGLTLTEFARRESLDVQRLRRWRERLAPREAERSLSSFVEVKRPASAVVEIVLLSGRVVWAPDSVDVDALGRVVAMLEDL
jgi:hypothetical protein